MGMQSIKIEYVVPDSHGAVKPSRIVGELSAVPMTVSEMFLQLTAEIGAQSWP
jgi:hypothetical protein